MSQGFGLIRAYLLIASFGLWLYLLKLQNEAKFKNRYPVLAYFLTTILGLSGFIVFLSLHAGGINLRALCGFAIASLVSPLLFLIVQRLAKIDTRSLESAVCWSVLESPNLSRWLLIPTALILFGYLGLVLCTILLPLENPQIFAIRCALLAFFLLALPSMVWVFGRVLASSYWTEEIRSSVAASVFPGISNALLLLLLGLWAFDLTGTGRKVEVFQRQIPFSPVVVGCAVSALVLTYLAPFLRGASLGRSTLTKFQNYKIGVLSRISLELSAPTPTPHIPLRAMRQRLESEMDQFWDTFPVLGIGAAIEDGSLRSPISKEAISAAKNRDLRFLHWNWFLLLTMKLEEVEADLARRDPSDLGMATTQWSKFFDGLREIYLRELNELSTRRTKLVVVASVIATFILTKAVELIWKFIEGSLR